MREEGTSCRVVNLRMIAPVDEEAIVETATGCHAVVVVEDHLLVGGIYQLVCEVLVRHRLSVPVLPFGLDGRWFRPALLPRVLDHEGFSVAKLAERLRRAHRSHRGPRPSEVVDVIFEPLPTASNGRSNP